MNMTETGERRRLFGIAYRMLGSVSDAEDAVQDCFLRWSEADRETVANPAGWLTTVLTRICIDRLRSARSRRETYVGTWLPEPVPDGLDAPASNPEAAAVLDESLSIAMQVVLETLSPAERAVFVLHDVFGYEFEEVAAVLERSIEACRQLAVRARAHVQARRPRFEVDHERQRTVVMAFLEATSRGDLGALLELLDPSVVLRADGGGRVPAAGKPIRGPRQAAQVVLGGLRWYPGLTAEVASVNGSPGALVWRQGRVIAVAALTIHAGRITEIDLIVNPEKLAGFGSR